MTNKQIRQLIASPTQVLVADGVDPESNLGYYGLGSIGKALLGITTASQGQEALSLVPGTHIQAYDSDLAALAALTTTGLIDRTGAGTATTRATGATGLNVLAAANEAAARTAIGAMANTAPEIITNANGTAYRWPNGLQICTFTGVAQSVTTGEGSIFRTTNASTWTFPAEFNAPPAGFGVQGVSSVRWLVLTANSTSSINYRQFSPVSGTGTVEPQLVAIGTYAP